MPLTSRAHPASASTGARWGGVFAVWLLSLLASLVLAGSGASRPPSASGGPTLAIARPDDDVSRPGSRTEWWYVHAVEPGSGRTVIVAFFSAPVAAVGGYLYTPARMTNWSSASTSLPYVGPGVQFADGGIRYDGRRGVWLADERAGGYRVQLVLSATRPGMTAGPLRFGSELGNWAVPVATGRADGSISTPGGDRIVIRNWRAYHEHAWGSFALESLAYQGWEFVRVTPTKTTACRPAITRQHWARSRGFRLPLAVTATCGGRSVTFYVTRPYVVPLTRYALSESVGRTDARGSIGLVEHLALLGS